MERVLPSRILPSRDRQGADAYASAPQEARSSYRTATVKERPTRPSTGHAHTNSFAACPRDNCVNPVESANCVKPATLFTPSFFIIVFR
jgi:hypothetical protein